LNPAVLAHRSNLTDPRRDSVGHSAGNRARRAPRFRGEFSVRSEAATPFDGVESPYRYLEKFDQVIDLVEDPKKWVKHTYVNRRGQYCLIGALNAVGVGKLFEPIILKTIDEMTDREFCSLESFNDHPETLHRDVIAVLYRAGALPPENSRTLR
jgi:hypothetical protein